MKSNVQISSKSHSSLSAIIHMQKVSIERDEHIVVHSAPFHSSETPWVFPTSPESSTARRINSTNSWRFGCDSHLMLPWFSKFNEGTRFESLKKYNITWHMSPGQSFASGKLDMKHSTWKWLHTSTRKRKTIYHTEFTQVPWCNPSNGAQPGETSFNHKNP